MQKKKNQVTSIKTAIRESRTFVNIHLTVISGKSLPTVAPVAFDQVNAHSAILAQRNRRIAVIYFVLASVSSESSSGAVTVVRNGAIGATGSERALGNLARLVVPVAQLVRFGTAAPPKVRADAGAARQRLRAARIHYELARLARISGRTPAGS